MWHKQYNNERRRADSIPAQSRAFTRAVIFVPLLSSMLDFKNDSFNFWEGVTLMTPLTDQSVAHSLLTLHFPINSAHLEPQPSKY